MTTQAKLQFLVFEVLSPSNTSIINEHIAVWLHRIPLMKSETLGVMHLIVFSNYGNKVVYRHLQQIDKEYTLMLDALYHYPEFPERILPLYQAAEDCLKEVHEHLRLNYAKYLDPLATMPRLLYRAGAAQIELKAAVLVQAMTRYHADKTLQAVVICKMTGLLQKGTGSWQEITALERIQKWIIELCAGRDSNITDELKDLLIRADFNTRGFVQYCQTWITADIAESYELREKYDLLHNYERYYSTLHLKNRALKFVPGKPKAKDQLLAFVRAELDYMAKKEAGSNVKATDLSIKADYRLPVSITVETLAYFFKLLVGTKVIQEKEKMALMLFIAKNFQTPGTSALGISVKSLNTKYRQVVKSTATMVRSMLVGMLNQLDKEF